MEDPGFVPSRPSSSTGVIDNTIDNSNAKLLPRRKLQEPDEIDAPDDCQDEDWENHHFGPLGNPHPQYTDVDYFSSQVLHNLYHESEKSKLKLVQHLKEMKKTLIKQQNDFDDLKKVLNMRIDESYKVIEDLENQLKREKENSLNQEIEMQLKLDSVVEGVCTCVYCVPSDVLK